MKEHCKISIWRIVIILKLQVTQQFDSGRQAEMVWKIPAWASKQKHDSDALFQEGLYLHTEELQF